MSDSRSIAYFSMEIGLEAAIPTYSGGLGVLAGDTIRAAADVGLPVVAVTLCYRKGYFFQRIDNTGWQQEAAVEWKLEDRLTELPGRCSVNIEGREVHLRAWKLDVDGARGQHVPILFLDADLEENAERDRRLTHHLYGGDNRYRLAQEIILGIGGVRMLRAQGYDKLRRFHMNEGHACLLTVELVKERLCDAGRTEPDETDYAAVKQKCVFTTHTPVAAGHDKFDMKLVDEVLGDPLVHAMSDKCLHDGVFNTTYLALNLSRYANGVAKRHGEVSRTMFGGYTIDSITNGIHCGTFAAPEFAKLFDKHLPDWRKENYELRNAAKIPTEEIWAAHETAKLRFINATNRIANVGMSPEVLTIVFARRAAPYKRPDLIFHDLERLRKIVSKDRPVQIVFAGKAHPRDHEGKLCIQAVVRAAEELQDSGVVVAYLPNYDMGLAKLMVAGADVWLNNPVPPLEASGTSGMKAALNGVPSLSTLDGWWIEGHIEGVTGWAIGKDVHQTSPDIKDHEAARRRDADSLYGKLGDAVIPCFYGDRAKWLDIMRNCIALNGSYFSTQRMVKQYAVRAYLD
ncbi:MAG: alpha-glucan family phosphorylase [Phycisphaerae bacterium]